MAVERTETGEEDLVEAYRRKHGAPPSGNGASGNQDDANDDATVPENGQTDHAGTDGHDEAADVASPGDGDPSGVVDDDAVGEEDPSGVVDDMDRAVEHDPSPTDAEENQEAAADADTWEDIEDDEAEEASDLGSSRPIEEISVEALGLMEHLSQDKMVAVRGMAAWRGVGVGIMLVGLLGVIADRRWMQTYERPLFVTEALIPLWQVGALVFALGLILTVTFLLVPGPRMRLAVPEKQTEAWSVYRRDMRRSMVLSATGWSLIAASGLLALYAVAGVAYEAAPYAVAPAVVLALAGTILAAAGAGSRSALRPLIMQTMLIAALEKAGVTLGAGRDGRVALVLNAVDGLLGKLPDDDVEAFLQTEAADMYLQLVEEYTGA